MLRRHPQVHMSRTKELHFFDRNYARGVEWYTAQFEVTGRHKQVGETTPNYMFRDRARSRLIATLPHARIVAILRNPVERAYSHYWHDARRFELQRHSRPVPPTFEAALAQERPDTFASLAPEPPGGGGPAPVRPSYVGRGEFLGQLEPFETAFSRARLHVILLEDLVADRVGTLRALFSFLEVKTAPAEVIDEVHVNRYREPDETGRARPAKYPPMERATRVLLYEHYVSHNARLGRWLGRDLSHWR